MEVQKQFLIEFEYIKHIEKIIHIIKCHLYVSRAALYYRSFMAEKKPCYPNFDYN